MELEREKGFHQKRKKGGGTISLFLVNLLSVVSFQKGSQFDQFGKFSIEKIFSFCFFLQIGQLGHTPKK
jgi:hypothetical protein